MLLRELFEAPETVGIIFGRFNPPHQGHKAAWQEAAKNTHWYVGTNQSTQGPKDPLPFEIKIQAMETIWPEIKGHIIPEQTWWSLAAAVYKKHGKTNLRIITDETDAKVFVPGLQKQNGVEGKHGFYDFASIEWQPAPRVSSATELRAAVANDDPKAFAKAAGVPADTKVAGKSFFELVKYYLGQYKKETEELNNLEIHSENFADGKVKGKSRPGRVKKSGASCNGSVTDLRAKAKKYGGERGRMYHWCANMKSGRKKS
jgi:nicotinamide mononucleotide adenylyltransferase